MADQLSLRVQYSDGGALESLQQITAYADKLDGRQVSLKIDPTGVKGMTSDQARAVVATAKQNTELAKQQLIADKVTASNQKTAQSLNGIADSSKKASDGLLQTAGKLATWMLLGNAISGVKRAFTDALGEMKNVDTELVEVRKVTGATSSELDGLRQRAYEVGSALGKSASAYLNSAADFARAGYAEMSGDLAELAMKTQLVGDVDSETANQFLLSVDAAYQYHGSVKELTKVLDGANEIDNKFATSIQKIAEGLGKVAPVAAMAGVGVDELSAALGTITAVTQRSGTEAATALRAIFMNIMGKTTTEVEDGVVTTKENVVAMLDLIKTYASDVYDAARADGKVINPMEGIAALAKSYQEGFLTEEEIMSKSMELGGKLRTTQLVALIKNWDMYKNMLTAFEGAAGSADKEVGNALDSWAVKSQRLSNSWTELISHMVDTGAVKGGLDALNVGVELLDTSLGKSLITGTAFFAALSVGAKIVESLKTSFSGIGQMGTFGWIGVAVAGITLLYNIIDSVTVSFDDLKKQAEESQKAYEEETSKLNDITTELDTQKKRMEELKALGKLSYVDQAEYDLLKKSTEQLQIQADIQKKRTELALKTAALDQAKLITGYTQYNTQTQADYATQVSDLGVSMIAPSNMQDLPVLMGAFQYYTKMYDESLKAGSGDFELYQSLIDNVKGSLWEQVDALQTAKDQMQTYYDTIKDVPYAEMTSDQKLIYDAYTSASETIKNIYKELDPVAYARIWEETGKAADNTGKTIEQTDQRIDQHAQNIQNAVDKYNLLLKAQKEQSESGKISEETYQALKALYGDQIDGLEEMADGAVMTSESFSKLTDAQKEYLESWGYKFPADNTLEQAITMLTELGEGLKSAKQDKEALDKALSGSTQGNAFDNYAEAYKNYQAEVKAGRVNSDTFWENAGFLLGDDELNKILMQSQTVEEAIATVQERLGKKSYYDEIFKSAEDDGQGFLKVLDKLADENGVVADGLATIKKTGKGTYTFDIPLENYSKLAEYLGISEENLVSVLDSLGQYGPLLELSGNDLDTFLEKSGVAIQKLADGTKVINVDDLVTKLREAGVEGSTLASVIQKLSTTDGIKLVQDDGTKYDPADAVKTIGEAADTSKTSTDNLSTSVGGIGTSADTANTSAGTLKTTIESLGDVNVTPEINTSWLSLAATLLNTIYSRLTAMNGVTYQVKLNYVTEKEEKKATGTANWHGGTVLVNDGTPVNGSPGELIVENGKAFIANGGNPAILNLDAGAKIYTAEQTDKILNGNKAPGESIPAFAGGTVVFPSTPSSGSGGSSSSGSSSSSSGSSSTSTSSQSSDAWATVKKYLDYTLQLIELKINEKQKEIDAITKERDALTAPIKEQISDLEWAVKTYEHEISLLERARDAVTKPIEDQIAALQKAHETEESTYELEKARAALQNAQNERNVRVFNKLTGQWEWQANAQNVETAQKSYADAQYNAQIKELEDQKDALAKQYDDQIAVLEEQKQTTENAIDDLNYSVDAITESYKDTLAVLEGQKTAIKEQYDAFREQIDLIDTALSEPTENLKNALNTLAKSGIAGISDIVAELNGVLTELTKTIGLSIGNLQTQLSPSTAIANLTQTSFAKGDNGTQVAYFQQALVDAGYALGTTGVSGRYDSATISAVKKIQKSLGLTQTGYADAKVIQYLREKLMGSTYDSGGVADKAGIMVKATSETEGVLAPNLMEQILNPKKNAQFSSFVNSLGILFGNANSPMNTVGYSAQKGATPATIDKRVYINGVEIGSNMLGRPLSDTLNALGLYCNP